VEIAPLIWTTLNPFEPPKIHCTSRANRCDVAYSFPSRRQLSPQLGALTLSLKGLKFGLIELSFHVLFYEDIAVMNLECCALSNPRYDMLLASLFSSIKHVIKFPRKLIRFINDHLDLIVSGVDEVTITPTAATAIRVMLDTH
jgi:hypothetical protein